MEPRLTGRQGPKETTGPTAQTGAPTAEHLVAISVGVIHRALAPRHAASGQAQGPAGTALLGPA